MECLLGRAADGSRPSRHQSGLAAQAGRDPQGLGHVSRDGLPGEDRRRAHRGDVSRVSKRASSPGSLQFTVYRGTNLLRQEAIAKTNEPSVAYKYVGGLKGFAISDDTRVVWRDTARGWQQYAFGGAVNQASGGAAGAQSPGHSGSGRRIAGRSSRPRTSSSGRAKSKPISATSTTARTARRPCDRRAAAGPRDRRQAVGHQRRGLDAAGRRSRAAISITSRSTTRRREPCSACRSTST